jgi:hypothetical protein
MLVCQPRSARPQLRIDLLRFETSSWTHTGAESNLGRFVIKLQRATAPPRHRPIARSYRSRDNYGLRVLLVAGGLDLGPLPKSDEQIYTQQHAKGPCHSRTLCRSQCLFEWRWLDDRIHQRSVGVLDRKSGNICG